jgi:hypothetical protein
MFPFFKKNNQKQDDATLKAPQRPRVMRFQELMESMGDFSDLAQHDVAMKFWLPELAYLALKEIGDMNGDSVSKTLRQFFAHHCYGIYAFQWLTLQKPELFKDPVVRFSRGQVSEPAGKKRIDTYWVPELGKNVVPVKVWVPSRIRNDLQTLASHVQLNLSQYVREIVISRLLGHGTLPLRPEMLQAMPLPAAQDWCDDKEVPMRQLGPEERAVHEEMVVDAQWVSV